MEITKFEVIDTGFNDWKRNSYYLCIVTPNKDGIWKKSKLKSKIRKYLRDKKEITINSSVNAFYNDEYCIIDSIRLLFNSELIVKELHENDEFRIKIINKYGHDTTPWVKIIYDDD